MRTKAILFTVFLLWQVGLAHAQSPAHPAQSRTILATLEADQSLHMFLNAVRLGGLAERLKDPEHLTVLAFSDKAFAKLPPNLSRSLLEQPHLFTLLLTHYLIPGDVMAADFASRQQIQSVDGLTVRFDEVDGKLRVQQSDLGRSDTICSNGVIHFLDSLDLVEIHQILMLDQQKPVR